MNSPLLSVALISLLTSFVGCADEEGAVRDCGDRCDAVAPPTLARLSGPVLSCDVILESSKMDCLLTAVPGSFDRASVAVKVTPQARAVATPLVIGTSVQIDFPEEHLAGTAVELEFYGRFDITVGQRGWESEGPVTSDSWGLLSHYDSVIVEPGTSNIELTTNFEIIEVGILDTTGRGSFTASFHTHSYVDNSDVQAYIGRGHVELDNLGRAVLRWGVHRGEPIGLRTSVSKEWVTVPEPMWLSWDGFNFTPTPADAFDF